VALNSVDPSSQAGLSLLRESLAHPKAEVRLTAAAGLVEAHAADSRTSAALRTLLLGKDQRMAVTAAQLLAAIDPSDRAATDHLSRAAAGDDTQVGLLAAQALAELGRAGPREIAVLTGCAQNADLGWGLQGEAVRALGTIGPSAVSALPTLEKLLTGSPMPPLRQAVEDAIRGIRGETSPSQQQRDTTPTLFDRLASSGGMRAMMGLQL
jgi:HEAT repeat protein